MARRTKEEIQKEVAAESAARKQAYFEAQEKAKAGAAAIAPDLPAADAYRYSYSWKQDPGAATGEYTLIKSPNAYYDASTNTIVDPATGERTPATQSMWSGPTTFRADGAVVTDPNAKDPVTGLTLAQKEAADALALAKGNAATLAAAFGAKIDPNTGKIISSTIDPTKAAAWYASQNPNVNGRISKTSTSDSTLVNNAATSTSVTGFGPGSQGYEERKSAYDLLYQQFAKYGLQGLVTPLESLIKEGVPASEFAIRLRETDAYQKRFAANKARINKGLAALSEAEYIGLEDAYQGIMRQYGMPESYYARGEMGRQEGFEKFIAGDVSPAELETRISTAYNRVINSNPEVVQALKQYYPSITNGDILSYVLDPEKGLTDINKKVTAAEIGGAAIGAGLGIGIARAEELGAFGVSKAQAQQGYQTIADILPSAKKLSDIYSKQGLGAYDQAVAEQEVFGISGAATAAQKRRKLTELETAQFSGTSGIAGGALARDRAGAI